MKNHSCLLLLATLFLFASCGKTDEYYPKVNPYQAVPIDTAANTTLAAGTHNILYPYGGYNRKFIIQLPANFDAQKTYPVVFAFHSATIKYTDWENLIGNMIDSREYIGIYPSAVDTAFNIGLPRLASLDDTGYIQRLIYWLNTKTNVKTDPARYYAMGISTGGAFVHYLALHSTTFAAITPISASLSVGMMAGATTSKHTPIIQIHGDPDQDILYGGGTGILSVNWQSAQSSIKDWAARNYCGNAPSVDTIEAGLIRYRYPEFVGAEETSLYVAQGVTDIYSTVDKSVLNNLIWNFFERHHK